MAAANSKETGESLEECRILIVGHSGSGKSTLGNKLLDLPDAEEDEGDNSEKGDHAEKGFVVSDSFDPGTKMCQYQTRTGVINGRTFSLKVIDTPGLFDPVEHDVRRILVEITRSMALCCPGGPHVIIFPVPYGRFTEEKEKSFDAIMELFGAQVKDHMLIVYTHGEKLVKKSVKEELRKCKAKGLQKVLKAVPDNYVVCTSLPDRRAAERTALLNMIGQISHNCTTHYSNEVLMKLTKNIDKEISKLMVEKGLSYARAIEEVRKNIVEAEDKKAFWVGLLKDVAWSALFAGFVGIFWGVGFAVARKVIEGALKAAAKAGAAAFLTSFAYKVKTSIVEYKNRWGCNVM